MNRAKQDGGQDLIDQEASDWLLQAESRDRSTREQEQFNAWRNADPRREATYAALSRTWNEIAALPGLAELVPLQDETQNAGEQERTFWSRRRRVSVAALASIAASFVAFLVAMPSTQPPDNRFATEVAQLRKLRLEDGTIVTLGPKSTLELRFSAAERRVALNGGEAFFEVAHNSTRPFFVEADQSVVRVVGTKFDVNMGAGTLRVSVLEGHVQVRPLKTADAKRAIYDLRAGQSLELAAVQSAAALQPAISTVPTAGSWRAGRLTYDNTRLVDVVADINRYYEPGVQLDRDINDLRVTASFRPQEIKEFLATLGAAMPVEVKDSGGGPIRLESR